MFAVLWKLRYVEFLWQFLIRIIANCLIFNLLIFIIDKSFVNLIPLNLHVCMHTVY